MHDSQILDDALVAKIREGDQDAASALFDRYSGRVFGLVRAQMSRKLQAQVEPQDIVQSVFRSIFRGVAAGNYDAPEGSTLWRLLTVIAINKVRRNANHSQAAKRDSRRTVSVESLACPEVLNTATEEEWTNGLLEAIEGLKESDQAIIILRVQGFNVEEISHRLGWSRRTVERTLQRIRQKLKDEMVSGD